MKKYILIVLSILFLIGCTDKKKEEIKENSNDNSNIESNSNSNSDSNSNSNIESNSNSNNDSDKKEENSNKVSNSSSNKSNSTSNKTSNTTSNKSNTTSNKTSNNTSNNTSGNIGKSSKGYDIVKKNGIYYVKGILIANKTYDLPSTYNLGGLLSEFNSAFSKMKSAASKDGISLWVKSGFRSYATQKSLYNNYVARDGKAAADRYSARPGHSEHQTGLAADFNEISDTFGDTAAGKWLSNNCWKYGFILRYPKGKESITGYMYESWHFRYIGDTDIAKQLYNNGNWIALEEYLGIDSKYK